MDQLPKNCLLEFKPNTLFEVRNCYGLQNPNLLNDSLDLLEDWVNKQGHFYKKDFSRDYLERLLMLAKGSVEKAKERLDKTCSLRNYMPQYFRELNAKDITNDSIGKVEPVLFCKMTDDNIRYFIARVRGNEFDTEMVLNVQRFVVMMIEYARAHDYAKSYEVVLDFRNINIPKILLTFNVLIMKDLIVIAEGYGARITGIHIITDSIFMDIVLKIAKQIIPKKLSDRIHVYNDVESLHEKVQKDVMPIEFGGAEKCLHDIFCDWVEILSSEEFSQYWKDMLSARTDESKRPKNGQDLQLGLTGTFRNLNLD